MDSIPHMFKKSRLRAGLFGRYTTFIINNKCRELSHVFFRKIDFSDNIKRFSVTMLQLSVLFLCTFLERCIAKLKGLRLFSD